MAVHTPGPHSADPNDRAGDASEDIFGQTHPLAPHAQAGPLSARGLKVRPFKTVTLGDFRILRKTGAGNMGAVYLAYQLSQSRHVALKILGKQLARRPDFVERFYREAALMDRINHPGIVACYGVGQEQGFHYFIMEYVDGIETAVLLSQLGGKFTLGDGLHIVLRCAEALAAAALHNVVHRDVKPQNILVTRQGEVKITDLGLAKPMESELSLTDSHTGMGTPSFIPPEQARNAKHADHRSDIYALGGVLYYFLTGELPFRRTDYFELIRAKEEGNYRPASQVNRSVPRRCDEILSQMIAPAPANRYPSYEPLIADLEKLGLANKRLSFNLHKEAGDKKIPVAVAPPRASLEILLIYDDLSYIPLVEEAIQASDVPTNLSVVEDGRAALALLRKVSKSGTLPRPHLLVLGLNEPTKSTLQVLAAIQGDADLRQTPLRGISTVPEAADLMRHMGLDNSLWVTGFDDLEPVEELIRSTYDARLAAL
jgi:serine/threonine protein kinase